MVLATRPIIIQMHKLENEHIPTSINQNFTYPTVDSSLANVLIFHDNRFASVSAERDKRPSRLRWSDVQSFGDANGVPSHSSARNSDVDHLFYR